MKCSCSTDNGVADEPPLRIFVMGDNVWRSEREWPLARTQFTSYYVTSSDFPHFDRNPNTGLEFGKDTLLRTANQTVYHDSRYPSHIVLPVIPRKAKP